MYAVIRAGGKQYRVAPGDVIRVEKTPVEDGRVEFSEVLAVSGADGQIGRPGQGRVVGHVLEQGRGDKVLVFHYKRKKQYKKLRGHRQPFTAVRITEIAFDGQRFTAPELPAKPVNEAKPARTKPVTGDAAEVEAEVGPRKVAAHKKSTPKKGAKKASPKKKPKKK
jgi:large subunit ribosomal protein L21